MPTAQQLFGLESKLHDHFVSVFGEDLAEDTEVYEEYLDAFDSSANVQTLEDELTQAFMDVIESVWPDQAEELAYAAGKPDESYELDAFTDQEYSNKLFPALAQSMVAFVLEQAESQAGSFYPDFISCQSCSDEVANLLEHAARVLDFYFDPFGRLGQKFSGAIFSAASEQTKPVLEDWLSNAEYAMTGDATEAVKDYVAGYEEEEYEEEYEEFPPRTGSTKEAAPYEHESPFYGNDWDTYYVAADGTTWLLVSVMGGKGPWQVEKLPANVEKISPKMVDDRTWDIVEDIEYAPTSITAKAKKFHIAGVI